MTKISNAQTAVMVKFTAETVVITSDTVAQALIRKGMVQRASIDPEPTEGVAISATTKGRSWLNRRQA